MQLTFCKACQLFLRELSQHSAFLPPAISAASSRAYFSAPTLQQLVPLPPLSVALQLWPSIKWVERKLK
jgi:hypothetical protein